MRTTVVRGRRIFVLLRKLAQYKAIFQSEITFWQQLAESRGTGKTGTGPLTVAEKLNVLVRISYVNGGNLPLSSPVLNLVKSFYK